MLMQNRSALDRTTLIYFKDSFEIFFSVSEYKMVSVCLYLQQHELYALGEVVPGVPREQM